jgi:hypothetical protein
MKNKYLNPKNYINFAINKFMKLISPIIKSWENKYIKKYTNEPLKHQPVFIIGAPRTGSTILYQTITNQLDVLYVDNLTCRFNKNFFFGFWLSNKLFKQKAHNCFKSNHGNTSKCGLHAPSECGEFWYRWLPTDRHFIDYEDINDDMVEQVRKEITTVINYFDKPLVFKNLNAGQRLRLLQKCFPDAKFIFSKRDTIFTAQSILKAKRKLNLEDDKYWGILSKNFKELEKLNYSEQIVKQIFYIEKQIHEDIKLFNDSCFLTVDYLKMGECLEETIDECTVFIKTNDRFKYQAAEVKLTEKLSLDIEEIEAFKCEILKLDWENYSDI